MKVRRVCRGIALVSIYMILYYPAVLATKFSDWFWEWDLDTFGW